MDDAEIFTIWITDREWGAMPYLYEICIASWQVMNPKRRIVIYTNHNLHLSFLDRKITEIRQLDDYFPGLYQEACKICELPAHQSDYIRYTILRDRLGIYLDTDVLCYDSIDTIVNIFNFTYAEVIFCKEDDNMICNACILSKGTFKDVFDDILSEYRYRFIKHSYLFNSQKYLWLMKRRYDSKIFLAEDTIFSPSWQLTDDEKNMFLNTDYNESITNFKGFGHHLYSSVDNWKKMREYIDMNLYNKEPKNYIEKLTNNIINKYINLMKEVD